VTGTLRAGTTDITGRLDVSGVANGFVRLTRTGATGRLGGRTFTYRAPRGIGATAARAGAHRVGVAPGGDLLRQLVHPRARRIVP
jgi:hypothetical protein